MRAGALKIYKKERTHLLLGGDCVFLLPKMGKTHTNGIMILIFEPIINRLDKEFDCKHAEYRYQDVYSRHIVSSFDTDLINKVCIAQRKINKDCNAKGKLKRFGFYTRACIRDIVDGVIVCYFGVRIARYRCHVCRTTHALLTWFLPPYSRHTLRFILTVLREYYQHVITVEEICEYYEICVTTLYAWEKKYREQYFSMKQQYTVWADKRFLSSSSPPMESEIAPELSMALLLLLLEDISRDRPERYELYYREHHTAFLQIRHGMAVHRTRVKSGRAPPKEVT